MTEPTLTPQQQEILDRVNVSGEMIVRKGTPNERIALDLERMRLVTVLVGSGMFMFVTPLPQGNASK